MRVVQRPGRSRGDGAPPARRSTQQQTAPLIEFYEAGGVPVHRVDGTAADRGGSGRDPRRAGRLIISEDRRKKSRRSRGPAPSSRHLYGEMPARGRAGRRRTAELDRFAEDVHSRSRRAPSRPSRDSTASRRRSAPASITRSCTGSRRGAASSSRATSISIDCGVKLDGFFADAAITLPVGEVGPGGRSGSSR